MNFPFSVQPQSFAEMGASGKMRCGCPLLLLMRLLIQALTATATGLQQHFALVSYSPPFIRDLVEDHNTTVGVYFTFKGQPMANYLNSSRLWVVEMK